jgi:hypothetical protein
MELSTEKPGCFQERRFLAKLFSNNPLSTKYFITRLLNTSENRNLEYWLYIFIGLSGVGLNELFIWLFTDQLHIYYLISKILAGSTVFFYNFFTRKYLLFR